MMQENRCDALISRQRWLRHGMSCPLPALAVRPRWIGGAGAAGRLPSRRDSACPARPSAGEAGRDCARSALAQPVAPAGTTPASGTPEGLWVSRAGAALGLATAPTATPVRIGGGFARVQDPHSSAQDPFPTSAAERHGIKAGNPDDTGVEFLYRRQENRAERRFPRQRRSINVKVLQHGGGESRSAGIRRSKGR